MYILLRKKYIFNIIQKTEDKNWIYLKGSCKDLFSREVTICLENKKKERKRIIEN